MIDLRQARERPDELRAALARKGAADLLDELLASDAAVREVQPRVEELRAARKVKGKPTPEQLAELERVKQELQQLEEQLAAAEARRKQLLERVPNPPDEGTPDGFSDEDAVEIRRWGDPPSFDFPVRDHMDLAQALGWEPQRHDLADAHRHIPADDFHALRRERLVVTLPVELRVEFAQRTRLIVLQEHGEQDGVVWCRHRVPGRRRRGLCAGARRIRQHAGQRRDAH